MNLFKMLFQKSENLQATELAELLKNGATLIDVRTPEEYKSGHIATAKNFPLQNLQNQTEELKKLNAPLIAVCRSGGRSSMATKILNSKGIKTYNAGGWSQFQQYIK